MSNVSINVVARPQKVLTSSIELQLAARQGLSAYEVAEVAVAAGFVGTEAEWLESLVGETGERNRTRLREYHE